MSTKTKIHPYLIFRGRCEEAAEFYRGAVSAEIAVVTRFGDAPHQGATGMPPAGSDKVMHMEMKIGESSVLASDGMCPASGAYTEKPTFAGFSLTYAAATAEDADRAFARLSDGGAVDMPLAKTFFAEKFGTVTDRFGVSWMVIHG